MFLIEPWLMCATGHPRATSCGISPLFSGSVASRDHGGGDTGNILPVIVIMGAQK